MNGPDSPTATPLKRSSVIGVVLLSLLTAGIYTSIWYLRRRRALNSLDSPTKLGVAGPVILLILTVIYLMMPAEALFQRIVLLAVGVTNIVLAFRVRWMLVDHLGAQMSAVLPRSAGLQAQSSPSSILTFLFNIWYLQYAINEFIEESRAWASANTPMEADGTALEKT